MASLAAARRLSIRYASRQFLRRDVSAQGFRTSAACPAAQNFTMPALSPTMTEGNIAKWNVKEGDSFSAGDVLLEIETDKASMDVEAQDDGLMAKIIQGDGSKGIKVGARIGVLAESGDDLSSLEIPEEEASSESAPPTKEVKSDSKSESPSQAEAPPTSKPSDSSSEQADTPAKKGSEPSKKQTYPLLPSVEHLLHEHGLDESAISKMTPSGPNNRLLKGDVLAYLGSVSASYPSDLSSKIARLSHLDLSNIKLAPPKTPAAPTKSASLEKADEPAPSPAQTDVAVPISMKAVLEVQKRIQSTLGVFMPLSTFIARATDVANEDLPRAKHAQPSTDELFNQILGLDTVSSSSSGGAARGTFLPQIAALPQLASTTGPARASPRDVDIIDMLCGPSKRGVSSMSSGRPRPGLSSSMNLFTVTAQKGEEKRAQVFLERVKSVLEGEPGRLVL